MAFACDSVIDEPQKMLSLSAERTCLPLLWGDDWFVLKIILQQEHWDVNGVQME